MTLQQPCKGRLRFRCPIVPQWVPCGDGYLVGLMFRSAFYRSHPRQLVSREDMSGNPPVSIVPLYSSNCESIDSPSLTSFSAAGGKYAPQFPSGVSVGTVGVSVFARYLSVCTHQSPNTIAQNSSCSIDLTIGGISTSGLILSVVSPVRASMLTLA